jgi:hypothetical protein
MDDNHQFAPSNGKEELRGFYGVPSSRLVIGVWCLMDLFRLLGLDILLLCYVVCCV